MRLYRRRAALALGILLLGWSVRHAAAADVRPAVRLQYENDSTAASCPSEREFRDCVASRIGFDPFDSAAKETIKAKLRDEKQRVVAEVVLLSGEASDGGTEAAHGGFRRVLTAQRSECGELAESMAVAISILLDPLGRANSPSPPPSATTAPVAAPEVPEPNAEAAPVSAPPKPREQPAPTKTDSLHVQVGFGPTASMGLGPGIMAGGRLSAALDAESRSIGVEVNLAATPGAAALDHDRVYAFVLTGGVAPCLGVSVFKGCAIASVGYFQGEGAHVVDPVARRTLVAYGGLRAAGTLHLSRSVSLAPTLDLSFALARAALEISNEVVWTAPLPSATLGLEGRLRLF